MKFDELDEKMRVYETALDHCVLPEMFMVARIDARGSSVQGPVRRTVQRHDGFDDRTPDELRVPGRLRLHAERRNLAAVPSPRRRFRAQTAEVRLDPGRRGEREVRPASGSACRLRLSP